MVLASFAHFGWDKIAVRKRTIEFENIEKIPPSLISFGKEGWEKKNAIVLDW